jgi:hypothetical protein
MLRGEGSQKTKRKTGTFCPVPVGEPGLLSKLGREWKHKIQKKHEARWAGAPADLASCSPYKKNLQPKRISVGALLDSELRAFRLLLPILDFSDGLVLGGILFSGKGLFDLRRRLGLLGSVFNTVDHDLLSPLQRGPFGDVVGSAKIRDPNSVLLRNGL